MRRYLIPTLAFLAGTALLAGIYFGILMWAQDAQYAAQQFALNRWYVLPIWIAFGLQAALYSILRLRLFVPVASTSYTGIVMGTSGGTSVTAMVACCIHHVADMLPILGLSAAATFLTRYQRPFMLLGLSMNLLGIIALVVVLYRERRKLGCLQDFHPILETK